MNQPNNNQLKTGVTIPGQENLLNLQGFIKTIEFVPTAKPSRFFDQFYIVTSGGSSRAYLYDTINGWKYWALT